MAKTVATHNGVFHADDVFSLALLYLLGLVGKLVRTRDPKVLAEADMRVDVGGKDAPATGDYDHHQKGGAGSRANGIPYAAFGLVWKQHGAELCGSVEVGKLVEERLVQVIDAGDCGYDLHTGLKHQDVLPYPISAAISVFNPSWQENPKPSDFDAQFSAAVEIAKQVLQREIIRAKGDEEAKSLVRSALSSATDPRILVLDRFCPWQEVVIEEGPTVQFVLFPSETGDWRVQVVPESNGVFKARKDLPAKWAGKRDTELAELTGCSDAIFCHNARFIAGAKSKDSILRMAELALQS